MIFNCAFIFDYYCFLQFLAINFRLVLSRDKQLTCPECRRVSKVPIDRLLPNYTLNKVLETMPATPQSSFANYNTSQTLDSNSYQSSYLQPSQTSIEDTLSSEKLSATSK